ncbi:MAG: pilus assembly protein [Bryobacterales bacterium]|nr:pilus assembly protein [Bryobacterales bacterium]
MSTLRRNSQSGSSLLEFALFSIFLIPLFMGTVTTGMGLGKSIQVSQVSRDAGHMFVRQVDFSQTPNKEMIVRLSRGLNMTLSGGNGTVVLTQILMIGPAECTAAGLIGANCTNMYYPVITQRLVVGNSGLYTSAIGNPDPTLLKPDGTIVSKDSVTGRGYLTDTSCRANTLSTGGPTPTAGQLTLQSAERTFVSEAYFTVPQLSFLNHNAPVNLYTRNYF